MVKKLIVSTFFLACLLLLLAVAFSGWVLYSPSGTRWALTYIPDHSGVNLSIGRIEGAIGKRLVLGNIEFQRHGTELYLDSLILDSHLTGFLPPVFEVRQLRLSQLAVIIPEKAEQQKPETEVKQALSWPDLPKFLEILEFKLLNFELRDAEFQQQNTVVQIDQFQLAALWQNGQLQLHQISLATPELHAQGSGRLGVSEPLLQLDVNIGTKQSLNGWQQFQLQADLRSDNVDSWFRGPVNIAARGEQVKLLSAELELELSAQQLTIHQLTMKQAGRAGSVMAHGYLAFGGSALHFASYLQFNGLDLQAELGQALRLSGSLQIQGEPKSYSGQIDLHSKGNELTTAQLTAAFSGDPQSFSLNELSADWLDGTLAGQVQAGWTGGWQLQGQLNGNNLNPQLVYEQLDGRLNLGIDFAFAGGKNVDPQGQLELRIIDSVLHEQPLAGNAAVQVDGANMLIEYLHLYGEGLSLEAEGDPSERLDVSWQIEDLEQFLPDLQGNFAGKGWLRWQQNLLSGQVSAIGVQLGFKKWQLEQLKLDGGTEGDQNSWYFQLSGLNLTQDGKKLVDSWAAKLNGSIENHKLILMANEQNNHLDLSFVGGWHDQQWQGSLNKFQLDDARIGQWQLDKATGLLFSRPLVQVEPLLLRGESNQTIKLQGDFQPLEQLADTKVRWWNLDLSRFSFLLADTQIIGHSSGNLKLKKFVNSSLHAEMTIAGGLQWQQQLLQISQGNFLLDWIDNNLTGTVHLQLENGGRMNGKVTSTKAPAFKLPSQLQLQLTSSDFPLLMVQPWVPSGFNLTGMLDWELVGQWRTTGLIDMTGRARTANVGLSWEGENGNLSADIVASELKLEWHEQLVAELLIQLRERGVVTADLQIPVAAEIPFKIDSKTPVAADLQANLHERGLLSLLFPGQVQETQGELSLDLQLAGFLQKPIFQGEFQLYSGGAFLPSLGVKLDDIEIDGDFNDNLLSLTGMQIRSGEGDLHGSGQLELRNWQPGHYNLLLEGKDFQLINLPEMQARINPDLKIAGTGSEIKVRGDLIFPEVVVIGSTKNKLAGKSSDLVIVDAEKPPPRQQKVTHDIDIQVDLEQILVNDSGLDAKLAGGMRLYSADNQKDIAANGKIKIIKGKFSSYGVNLDIDHGGIYFSGPVNQPTLDILALRTVDDVQAGVKVSGTPQLPEVDLYSKPFMPDTDILAYIVLGRPFSAEGSDTGLLMRAAEVLLSAGESAMLQQKLKGRLGLDVLDFSAGGGDIHDSVITTGKYLNPDLYVSLGHSLFKNTNEVNIRYSLTPSWELESDIGVESGVDLYYKIEIK